MKKIRTALIGYGKIAHSHAKALHNISSAELVAVSGRNGDKAGAFANRYSIRSYSDTRQMISESNIEAVIITTPHPNHITDVLIAAGSGVNILVEKPLAASLEDCDVIIDAAKKAGVKLGVISQRRYYEPVLRLKQAIEDGKIGKPVLGIAYLFGWRGNEYYESDPWRGKWKEEGGGVLVNQSPHPIDILQWFLGPIDELYGYHDNYNHPFIEVEDTAAAIIRFKSGAMGNLLLSNSIDPALYGKIHVFGSNGSAIGVQTDSGAMFLPGQGGDAPSPFNDIWTVKGEGKFLERWQEEDNRAFNSVDPNVHYFQLQIEDFIQSILNNSKPFITGEDGRKTVEIFTAIYRSQRDHRPVKFPLSAELNRADYDGRLK